MLTPGEAYQRILSHIKPLGKISRPLDQSQGFTLAEDIAADRDSPAADRSAMDGYAVRSEDIETCPAPLRLIGEVPAGKPAGQAVEPGTCIRILTGANIPPNADTVVKIENTSEADGIVTIRESPGPGANIRKRGEEALKGTVLLPTGTVLGPAQIGLCAAVGRDTLTVFRRPRVLVLCTGEELKETGETVADHQIRDSNGPMLYAALMDSGYTSVTRKLLPDDRTLIAREMQESARQYDVVLLTGGVSVGKYDYVPASLEEAGATIHLHNVAVKPGKPLLYATIEDSLHVIGLPGNPVSVITGFYDFVLPALKCLSGVPREMCRLSFSVRLAGAVKPDRERYRLTLAKLTWDTAGPLAYPQKSHGSGDLVAGVKADGIVVVPPGTQDIREGTVIEFHPWSMFS
ncbi:gephyrin-like molybdotransferase Glp [Candidatus Latescibacterota bacterium]